MPSVETRRFSVFRRALLAAAAGSMLAACSGGGSAGSTPSTPSVPVAPAAPAAPAQPASGTSAVTFTMHWPSAEASSATRRTPAYVPASARSVSVAVNGGVPQYLNEPATTMSIDAPDGTDTFVFQTYDAQNGLGNVLSRANVTQAIVLGTSNTVSATLNGVIASISLSLGDPTPNAGAPATVAIDVAGLDADGNVIVGAGDYSSPISLAVSIPNPKEAGALSLSSASLPNAATSATLDYDGATLTTATVTASSSGVAPAIATLSPVATIYRYTLLSPSLAPQWIALGSDGNMWFTQSGGFVGKITPAGTVSEYNIGLSNLGQIIGASDGTLRFTAGGDVYGITTGGNTVANAGFVGSNYTGLVDYGNGSLWTLDDGIGEAGFLQLSQPYVNIFDETPLGTGLGLFGLTSGSDNALYFTESKGDAIGRLDVYHQTISTIPLTAKTVAESIVRGPDGNLWFTENGPSQIGRVAPGTSFHVTGEFPTLSPFAAPVGITTGTDGALWFTEQGLDRIGRITTSGTVTEYLSPVPNLKLNGIAAAPDGSIWFAEEGILTTPAGIGKLVY